MCLGCVTQSSAIRHGRETAEIAKVEKLQNRMPRFEGPFPLGGIFRAE